MKTLSKIAPIALLVGALILSISSPAGADRRIIQISGSDIPDPPGASSDPEVPNQAYRGPGSKTVVTEPAELARRPVIRAVLSEVWYRRLLRFVAAQFWGGMVR